MARMGGSIGQIVPAIGTKSRRLEIAATGAKSACADFFETCMRGFRFISLGDWKSRLQERSPPARTFLKPVCAGFGLSVLLDAFLAATYPDRGNRN